MESKCLFVILEYVIGMPLYNKDMCKVFLVNTLKEESFDVQFLSKYSNISWEKVARRVDPTSCLTTIHIAIQEMNLIIEICYYIIVPQHYILIHSLLGNGNSSPESTENRRSYIVQKIVHHHTAQKIEDLYMI